MAEAATKEQEQPPSLQERLVEKSVKSMEKKVEEQTLMKLQSGQAPMEIITQLLSSVGGQGQQSPQNVLDQVLSLSGTQVPTGERMGLIPSLLKGHGTSRPELKDDLGIDNAIKVLGLQGNMQSQELDVPQKQANLIKTLLDLSTQIKGMGAESEEPERGPGGNLTTKGIEQQEGAQVRGRKTEEDRQKKLQLNQDLEAYFALGEALPTGEGFIGRNIQGASNKLQSLQQKTSTGVASGRLRALNKRLRVTFSKAAGEVGSLTADEQKSAELLLWADNDSTKNRQLKTATMKDLSRAINSGEASEVKRLIGEWMQSETFKSVSDIGVKQDTMEGKTATNPTTGETLIHKGGKWIPKTK